MCRSIITSTTMLWYILFACSSLVNAINRPVYKVALTQKGYAQFLQYDVETPPLREFTFCAWIRVYDLGNDQSIFTYVAKGNNRVVRLWLDVGGQHMKVSVNGILTSRFPVDIVKDVWRHVCLSYQSDYGALALYIDSRLVSCEAAQRLDGFVLPSGGSVIIGYGTADDGASNGLEGEIFGVNMILISTIERNYTIRKDPLFEQKLFPKNKVKGVDKNINNYIILSELQTDEVQNHFEKTFKLPISNFTTSFVEKDVGIDLSTTKSNTTDDSKDLPEDDISTTQKNQIDFWNLLNQAGAIGKFKVPVRAINIEQSGSSTQDISLISEYETPPPPGPPSLYFDKSLDMDKESRTESLYNLRDSYNNTDKKTRKPYSELSEIEIPPPITKDNKVYGQWTSSQYAGTVLKYLKSINFQNKAKNTKNVPQIKPLIKLTDSYPYASDFKISKLRPPPQFSRRNVIEKRYDLVKKYPQINVQILEDDLRSNIIRKHAQTRPKRVEITNRGESKKHMDHRFYRNVDYDTVEKLNSAEDVNKPSHFILSSHNNNNHRHFIKPNTSQKKSVLPFVKSLEYLISDSESRNDMYTKSLSNANKWHNVKSYNNDYTPRRINMESEEVDDHRKQYPSIRLKYKHEKELVGQDDDPSIIKGRELANEVSNQSDVNKDFVSLLKYNHGYLPTHDNRNKIMDKIRPGSKTKKRFSAVTDSFDKPVKVGNALNERLVLGSDEYQQKKSFEGGFENIPDINRYRSDIDDENGRVLSSLGPRVCKNVELYDRVLYVQQDESVDMTHILSPVRAKNIAIEFILQNYKKCSLAESTLENNSKLFIDWSKTPVRLFGGAYPRTTTDLCGFFK